MHKLQAIVFDLDDTLYSERDFVLSGFRSVAKWAALNLEIDPELGYTTLFQLYSEGVRNNTFNRWLEIHQIDRPEIIPELLNIYRQHSPNIIPFADAIDLLKTLIGSYQIGLVSDGYLAVQQRKWLALNLDSFFDAVVFSDKLGRENWKPSTAPFALVLQQLQVSPPLSVYIGDNPRKDFLGARQLGMYTIQFKHPASEYGHIRPPTPAHQPHLIAESFTEVLGAISQIESSLQIC
ncbi:HAD family hydrolase [Chamaesiphon sp.]|uniref:HAD family hydrolase n=1 Tax=Chamaesiphon sp. TaxID=2814140 RepID=UPI00359355FC